MPFEVRSFSESEANAAVLDGRFLCQRLKRTIPNFVLSCVCGLFVLNALLEFLLSQAGAKQAFRIRLIFMESVLSQEQKWIQANINEKFIRERLQ